MKTLRIAILSCAFLAIQFNLLAEKRKILFIGNSYTYVNDLPGTLSALATSMGDTLNFDSNAIGGATLQTHCTNAATLAKLQIPGWDYVVIQAQSQEPSFDPTQVAVETYPYAKTLDSLVHVSNPCAETIFFMTWGRKNGDASNCAAYPPICTYAGMQQRLRESYLEMASNNAASCAPVGVAWKNFRDLYPSVELYNADESHPSVNGTYLAACTFYSSLYHKSSVGSSYILSGVSATDAANIQSLASQTVLDSLESWQQHGSLPKAAFQSSSTGLLASFTNTSMRSIDYSWNFGDATPSVNTVNPTHTYSAPGTYLVTLQAMKNCKPTDVHQQSISILSFPNGLPSLQTEEEINCWSEGDKLCCNVEDALISLYNLQGQCCWRGQFTGKEINLHDLPTGLYSYQLIKNKQQKTGRFYHQ
jgi:hypothetical protein